MRSESADNLDVLGLTYEQLQDEYQRSQWALAWALKSLGGILIISQKLIAADEGKKFRTYYGMSGTNHIIEIKEYHE